jgi:ACS family sodium-dependent inorganic phosphate cotransporter
MTDVPPVSKRRLALPIEARYVIVLACFLATFTAYVERVGFSIAFTAMARTAQVPESVKGTVLSAFYWGYGVSQVLQARAPSAASVNQHTCPIADQSRSWHPPCAFLMQIPGGWAAQQHGGRLMLIISFASWSVACLCTPTSAKRVLPIIIARVCVGVAQGFLIPSIHTVLSQVRTPQ